MHSMTGERGAFVWILPKRLAVLDQTASSLLVEPANEQAGLPTLRCLLQAEQTSDVLVVVFGYYVKRKAMTRKRKSGDPEFMGPSLIHNLVVGDETIGRMDLPCWKHDQLKNPLPRSPVVAILRRVSIRKGRNGRLYASVGSSSCVSIVQREEDINQGNVSLEMCTRFSSLTKLLHLSHLFDRCHTMAGRHLECVDIDVGIYDAVTNSEDCCFLEVAVQTATGQHATLLCLHESFILTLKEHIRNKIRSFRLSDMIMITTGGVLQYQTTTDSSVCPIAQLEVTSPAPAPTSLLHVCQKGKSDRVYVCQISVSFLVWRSSEHDWIGFSRTGIHLGPDYHLSTLTMRLCQMCHIAIETSTAICPRCHRHGPPIVLRNPDVTVHDPTCQTGVPAQLLNAESLFRGIEVSAILDGDSRHQRLLYQSLRRFIDRTRHVYTVHVRKRESGVLLITRLDFPSISDVFATDSILPDE